ncbi:MAG TPA: hypothetical protein VMT76_18405 [Puia sp.]|nr:hypothetical protein [Puia sp.]
MKFVSSIFLTALLSFFAGLYLPWWSVALSAFVTALLVPEKPWKSFVAAFAGVFILWALLAAVIDSKNSHILSQKIAHIFPLGGSYFLLILVTAFIGALVGGFAGLTASYVRKNT